MVLSASYVEGELEVAGLTIFTAIAVASLVLLIKVYRAIYQPPVYESTQSCPTPKSGRHC